MVLPKNPSHDMNMIKKQYDLAKQSVILEIILEISNGSRFSVSLDEYTSMRNRHCLNINLHLSTKFWNLTITPITGSLPAEKIVDLVERIDIFEATGKHNESLNNMYPAIMTIKPTSIESESFFCGGAIYRENSFTIKCQTNRLFVIFKTFFQLK